MTGILTNNFVTIMSSIITTISTTAVIFYFKNRKIRSLEVLEYSNHPVRIFNSFIWIVNFSNVTAICSSLRLYLYGITEFNSYILAFLLNQITISLLIIITIPFHREYLDNELKTKKQQILFSAVTIIFWGLLIICQYLIFTFIPKTTNNKIIKTMEFIIWFYVTLFIALKYLKLYTTKNLKKIILTTKNMEIYYLIDIRYFDEYIAFYEIRRRTRIIISRDQIKSIEYKYQDKTIKKFT